MNINRFGKVRQDNVSVSFRKEEDLCTFCGDHLPAQITAVYKVPVLVRNEGMSDRIDSRYPPRPPPAGASSPRSVAAAAKAEDSTDGARRRNGASRRRTPVLGECGAGGVSEQRSEGIKGLVVVVGLPV